MCRNRFWSSICAAQALPNESAITPLPQDSPVLRSELDIISSRMMARKVIDILQADNVNVPTAFRSGTVLSAPPENAKQVREARDVDAAARERQRIDLLLSRLRVNNDGRSYTIFISYRAPDPVYAARVANAFVTAYLDHQIDVQQSAARRVSEWLGEKLVSLRSDLEGAERAAEDFRQNRGLPEIPARSVSRRKGLRPSIQKSLPQPAQYRLQRRGCAPPSR